MNLTEEQLKSIAIKSIEKYLNNYKFNSDFIESNFQEAIIVAIEEYKEQMKQPSNISSMTQGARSVTYKDSGIGTLTNNVKNLLPKPYLRMW